MKILLILAIFTNFLLSKVIEEHTWTNGESLLTFLNKKNISKNIYFNLSKTDQELCSEIQSGVKYTIASVDGKIENIFIPISEEMQIDIHETNSTYKLEIIPIIFSEVEKTLVISIKNSPYEDIILTSRNYKLAHEFVRNFKKAFNFRTLQPNDKIAIKYKQKIKLGKYYGTPEIIAATVQGKYKKIYIYKNPSDDRYYDKNAKSLTSVFFKIPLTYRRISSKFTYKRFHPIKKRYMAHLGVDYAAPTGRKIYATAPGKIIFMGRKGGYGNTIIIQHKGGYKSLYAHQSKFSPYVKRGSRVKQGQHIGYVGTSGRSTGPHLHFGLYKNGRAVNPAKVMRYSKNSLSGKTKRDFLSFAKKTKNELLANINDNAEQFKIMPFESYSKIDNNTSKSEDFTIRLSDTQL